MGMLLRRHRIESLKQHEADREVAEAMLEAKQAEAAVEEKPKKTQPKKEA